MRWPKLGLKTWITRNVHDTGLTHLWSWTDWMELSSWPNCRRIVFPFLYHLPQRNNALKERLNKSSDATFSTVYQQYGKSRLPCELQATLLVRRVCYPSPTRSEALSAGGWAEADSEIKKVQESGTKNKYLDTPHLCHRGYWVEDLNSGMALLVEGPAPAHHHHLVDDHAEGEEDGEDHPEAPLSPATVTVYLGPRPVDHLCQVINRTIKNKYIDA